MRLVCHDATEVSHTPDVSIVYARFCNQKTERDPQIVLDILTKKSFHSVSMLGFAFESPHVLARGREISLELSSPLEVIFLGLEALTA